VAPFPPWHDERQARERRETKKHSRDEQPLIQMKKMRWLTGVFGLWFVCLLLPGCETTGPGAGARRRFQEGAAADLILRFYRWDTIYMMRPATRQGGFLPILTRADIERELKTRRLGHNLAVVVIGFLYSQEQEAQLARDWDALLLGQGFRRVVLLRAGSGKDIDGLLIVHDSGIAAVHDQPVAVATANAALPAAARADAPNSPGH